MDAPQESVCYQRLFNACPVRLAIGGQEISFIIKIIIIIMQRVMTKNDDDHKTITCKVKTRHTHPRRKRYMR